jgi:hypothetical protein
MAMQLCAWMIACLFLTWIFHIIATIKAHMATCLPKKTFIYSLWPQLPLHDRCCPNNKENGPRLDHFAITYISYNWSMKNIVEEKDALQCDNLG